MRFNTSKFLIEVINEFNIIRNKYRNLYFDIYTVLLNCDWRPLDDYIGHDNFDFLVTSELYDRYMFKEECSYSEVVDSNNIESFEVEIFNCKSIRPPEGYVCSIKDFSDFTNITIEDLLNKYSKDKFKYKAEIDELFISNSWTNLFVDDVEDEGGECIYDVFDLEVYVSPFMYLNLDEYNIISKDNIYNLLDNYPNLIVDVNLWWNYVTD